MAFGVGDFVKTKSAVESTVRGQSALPSGSIGIVMQNTDPTAENVVFFVRGELEIWVIPSGDLRSHSFDGYSNIDDSIK